MLVSQDLPEIKVSFVPTSPVAERRKINCSSDAIRILREIWNDETIHLYEEFIALFLDRKNGVIGYRVMNRGSNCATVVDIKLIFAIALQCNSSCILISHNHPSCNTRPSQHDDQITERINKGTKLFDFKLLDHIIVSQNSYYSYMDEGRISGPTVFCGFLITIFLIKLYFVFNS